MIVLEEMQDKGKIKILNIRMHYHLVVPHQHSVDYPTQGKGSQERD
jgi:hypothetical protein